VRIIAGTARGTKLRALSSNALRPMLDRVKESLFNIIRHDLPGARVLDLFSGTGSLGLEALSRGAAECVFVEQDPRLAGLVEENAESCGLAERCRLVQGDVLALPERQPPSDSGPADLVFVDPPYVMVDDPNSRPELLGALERLEGRWIGRPALLVLHHRPIPHAIWPVRKLLETDKRIYGGSQLTFFEWAENGDD
jgi:16S rRNA (guanine(966)-N(2))-methyltransferase RsmD